MSSIPADQLPFILGHRGASSLAPENTLAAFRRAIDDGADGIEFDVRLSRDNVAVVIHDASLKRTGLINRPVIELTAAELQQVDVGTWFGQRGLPNDQYAGETLPTFANVLELFQSSSGLLYPEMKCEPNEAKTLAATVVEAISQTDFVNRIVVEGFDLPAIAEVKRLDKSIRTAALFEPKVSRPLSTLRRRQTVTAALDHGADEIALHHSLASARLVEHARSQGLEVVVWTVDDPVWVERARAWEIKALIANNPGPLVKHRNELDKIG